MGVQRLRMSIAGLLCASLLAAAGAAAASSPHPPAPRAKLTQFLCRPALDPAARVTSVTAVMRSLPGTQKLAMSFTLLQRTRGAAAFSAVSGPGLGVWLSPSNPTLGSRAGDVWVVKHPVADLDAPAAYRFEVAFRWTGAHGRVLETTTRYTRSCRQPELRPDLVVDSITVRPNSTRPQLDDYLVVIGNTGATAAGAFMVELSDAGTVKDKSVVRLGAHDSTTVRFVGPACNAAARPTVTIDPQGQVDVSSRARATATVRCPAARSAT